MTVSEAAPLGTTIGKIMADDSDIGENAAMNYVIEGDASYVFDIITDNETQEGVVILKKVRHKKTLLKWDMSLNIFEKSTKMHATVSILLFLASLATNDLTKNRFWNSVG